MIVYHNIIHSVFFCAQPFAHFSSREARGVGFAVDGNDHPAAQPGTLVTLEIQEKPLLIGRQQRQARSQHPHSPPHQCNADRRPP